MPPKLGRISPHLRRTKVPTSLDIAWAAGIYEEEGHIIKPNGYSAHVGVTQKDVWLLYKLKELFGGSIYLRKTGGCPSWYVCGARARGFAMTVYQFLSPRRKLRIREILS